MATTWRPRQSFATASNENVQQAETESTAEVLEVGDFRIDTRRYTVTLRGEPLALTSEEFDVLVFLTTNPQHLVTPQTTFATRWTGARKQQTQFLRALLSLRKKLEIVATGRNNCGPNRGSSTALTPSPHQHDKAPTWGCLSFVELPAHLYELFMHSLDSFYVV